MCTQVAAFLLYIFIIQLVLTYSTFTVILQQFNYLDKRENQISFISKINFFSPAAAAKSEQRLFCLIQFTYQHTLIQGSRTLYKQLGLVVGVKATNLYTYMDMQDILPFVQDSSKPNLIQSKGVFLLLLPRRGQNFLINPCKLAPVFPVLQKKNPFVFCDYKSAYPVSIFSSIHCQRCVHSDCTHYIYVAVCTSSTIFIVYCMYFLIVQTLQQVQNYMYTFCRKLYAIFRRLLSRSFSTLGTFLSKMSLLGYNSNGYFSSLYVTYPQK